MANWVENGKACWVTFNSMGGTAIDPQGVAKNQTLAAPKHPAKEGYQFAGWYTKQTGGTKIQFSKKITADLTVNAR